MSDGCLGRAEDGSQEVVGTPGLGEPAPVGPATPGEARSPLSILGQTGSRVFRVRGPVSHPTRSRATHTPPPTRSAPADEVGPQRGHEGDLAVAAVGVGSRRVQGRPRHPGELCEGIEVPRKAIGGDHQRPFGWEDGLRYETSLARRTPAVPPRAGEARVGNARERRGVRDRSWEP